MTDNATTVTYQLLDRNLGLDLMRVTEAAAPSRRPVGRQG